MAGSNRIIIKQNIDEEDDEIFLNELRDDEEEQSAYFLMPDSSPENNGTTIQILSTLLRLESKIDKSQNIQRKTFNLICQLRNEVEDLKQRLAFDEPKVEMPMPVFITPKTDRMPTVTNVTSLAMSVVAKDMKQPSTSSEIVTDKIKKLRGPRTPACTTIAELLANVNRGTACDPIYDADHPAKWMDADVTDWMNELIAKHGNEIEFPRTLALQMWGNRGIRFWTVAEDMSKTSAKRSLRAKDPTGIDLFFDCYKRWFIRLHTEMELNKELAPTISSEADRKRLDNSIMKKFYAQNTMTIRRINQYGTDTYKKQRRQQNAKYYELLNDGYRPTPQWTIMTEVIPWEVEQENRDAKPILLPETNNIIEEARRLGVEKYAEWKQKQIELEKHGKRKIADQSATIEISSRPKRKEIRTF